MLFEVLFTPVQCTALVAAEASHDAADALLLRAVEIKNILDLTDVLFEVVSLVDSSGESVNEVVLIRRIGVTKPD